MKRFTMNIIARLMEISIHRIHPTIIHKVARTPQEEGSDQDVKIWWVSKTTFDFLLNYYFMKNFSKIWYSKFFVFLLVEVLKEKISLNFFYFGCSLVQNFISFDLEHKKKWAQNSKMLKKTRSLWINIWSQIENSIKMFVWIS